MKRIYLLLGTLVCVMSVTAFTQDKMAPEKKAMAAPAKQDNSAIEQALVDKENKWAEADKKGDTETIGAMIADGWVGTNADGKMATKKEMLDLTKKSKWDVDELSDIKAHVHGNVAIVTGQWRGKGTSMGKAVDTTERWTDTWMKSGNDWKCIGSQSTTIKK